MSSGTETIVGAMAQIAPPGRAGLDDGQRRQLQQLTGALLDSDTASDAEYRRYRDISERGLNLAPLSRPLHSAFGGKRIVVTGGTGCIGSTLVRQLVGLDPASVTSVQALSGPYEQVPGVEYRDVDLRDEDATRAVIRELRPDVIFHTAAQRSPWLAEREVVLTIESNVLGTRNVLRAARDIDLGLLVHASTGKAMRYYTGDVYAGTKKMAEWLVHAYAAEGRTVGMARFTHVVDNAVVVDKIDASLDRPDGVMRLHDPNTVFYAQSARESAQLLTVAGLDRSPGLHAVAIRSLGEPASLLDIVVGRMRARRDEAVSPPTIYVSGLDRGYENGSPPGLYDPETAYELSPLINAVEAETAAAVEYTDNVDGFTLHLPRPGWTVPAMADQLEALCRRDAAADAAALLRRNVRDQAEATLRTCPDELFARIESIARRAGGSLPTTRHSRERHAA